MRKTKHWLMTIAALLCSVAVNAYDYQVNGICYNIISSIDLTVEVTSDVNNNKYEGNVVIPSKVSLGDKEYKVVSIGDHAFNQCFNLSSVTIPYGVVSIGLQSFAYCYNLTSINIPSSVSIIRELAFEHCRSLTAVSIPSGVTRIRQGTFRGCDKLTSVTLSSSVDVIELWAFSDCVSLSTISLPASVAKIEREAFMGCSKLSSVYCMASTPPMLESSVFSEISSSAVLYVLKNLESSYMEAEWGSCFSRINGITGSCGSNLAWALCNDGELIIEGQGAMTNYSYNSSAPWKKYANSITKLTIKEGVTSIGDYAFYECTSLTSVNLPEGLKTIGKHVFYYCKALSEVYIPSTVTSIGMCAFNYCNITEINLPAGIKKIESSTFTGNPLAKIDIPDGVVEIGENSFCDCKLLESITIPNSVNIIGSMAFQYCKKLATVIMPKSVTSIGSYAFSDCLNLTSITISEGITSIEKNLFSGCTSLKSINIPEGVTKIGENAFSGCSSMSFVVIPESVTEIRESAFYGCESLTSVTSLATTPPTLGTWAFYGVPTTAVLCVPGSSINRYKNASGWKGFSNVSSNITWELTDEGELIISGFGKMTDSPWSGYKNSIKNVTIEEGVTSIGSSAFYNCNNLTSIIIPESVKSIEDYAFEYCSSLNSITIPQSVTSIKDYTFTGCTNLVSAIIPEGVTTIGRYAFSNCSSLKSIIIPEGVTAIGYRAFDGCSSLTSIIIPESVNEIGGYAFNCCNSITLNCPNIGEWFSQNEAIKEIVLGEKVTSIANRAFQYCSNLTSVTISESLTSIGGWAFFSCTSLKTISIPENSKLTSIGERAFGGCRNLTSIICKKAIPPTITSTTFADVDKSIPLYVFQPYMSIYQSALYWKEFANIKGIIPQECALTINQYGSGTYCSPYALDFSEVAGLKAYAATGYNTRTGVVTLTRVMTAKAGEGLFIKGEPGDYMVPVMEDTDDNTLNMLVGTLTSTDLNGTSDDGNYTNYKYTIKVGDAEPMFYQFDDGSTLAAERAYLQIPTKWLPQTESKAIRLRFVNGATTNIEEIESTENGEQSTAIYDLMGRRVENPSKGCVYIVNGCKVIY